MKSAWMTLFLFLSLFESVWKLNKCVYYREQRKVFRSCFDWSKLRKKARSSLRFDVMLLWQFILCYVLASYSHMIDLKICKKNTNTMTSKPRKRKKAERKTIVILFIEIHVFYDTAHCVRESYGIKAKLISRHEPKVDINQLLCGMSVEHTTTWRNIVYSWLEVGGISN